MPQRALSGVVVNSGENGGRPTAPTSTATSTALGAPSSRPSASAQFSFWTGPTAPPLAPGAGGGHVSAPLRGGMSSRGDAWSSVMPPGAGQPSSSSSGREGAVDHSTARRGASTSASLQQHQSAPAAPGAGGAAAQQNTHGSPAVRWPVGAAGGGGSVDDDATHDGASAGASRNRKGGAGWAWAQDGEAALTAAAAAAAPHAVATPPRRSGGGGGHDATGFFNFGTPLLASLMSGGIGRRAYGYQRTGSSSKLSDSEDTSADGRGAAPGGGGGGDGVGVDVAHLFVPRDSVDGTDVAHPLLGDQRSTDPYALYASVSGTPLRERAVPATTTAGGSTLTSGRVVGTPVDVADVTHSSSGGGGVSQSRTPPRVSPRAVTAIG